MFVYYTFSIPFYVVLFWAVSVVDALGANEPANLDVSYINELLPAQEMIVLQLTGPSCLALAFMEMRYIGGKEMPINQMRWKPMGIIVSFYN